VESPEEMSMTVDLDKGLVAERKRRPLLLLSELRIATDRARGEWNGPVRTLSPRGKERASHAGKEQAEMAESSSDHQKNVAAGCCGHPGGEGSAAETEEKVVRDRAEEDRARRLAIYRLAGTQAVREQRSVLALRDHLVHDIKENALHQGARPARLGSQRAARRLVAFNRERDAQQTARLSTRPHTELGGIDFLGSVSYPGMRPETTTGAWAGGVRAGSNGGGSGGGVDGDEDEEEGKGGLAVLLAAEKREREARGRERRRREEEEEAKLRVDIDFKVAVHRRHYERAIYPERAAELSAREAARFETEAMRARARAKEKREANTLCSPAPAPAAPAAALPGPPRLTAPPTAGA
jgi:hypothetical protein